VWMATVLFQIEKNSFLGKTASIGAVFVISRRITVRQFGVTW
jgi:hypothetical protein